jgi:KaiC/GvpD/RAD55 family RecA-like ATPase
MKADGVPQELRDRDQWVLWKTVVRKGKETKVPYQPNGCEADSTNPDTWSSFAEALASSEGYDGIGYVFSHYDPYVGIDLDGCRNPETGKVADWAREAIVRLNSYSEVSPSGTGVKVWVRGKSPWDRGRNVKLDREHVADKEPGIEVYESNRYFATTGLYLAGVSRNIEQHDNLYWLRETFDLPKFRPGKPPAGPAPTPVMERARRYVAKMPEAVSGSGGHNATFRVACVLCLGFGLSPEHSMVILQEYNVRCVPPWSERELWHKVNDAAKQPGERNYLRDAKPEDWNRIVIPDYVPLIMRCTTESSRTLVKTTLEEAAHRYLGHLESGSHPLISLGLPEVDKALGGGVDPGEVVILAARPSHGKSAVALQSIHVATASDITCLLISEEMSVRAIGKRAVHFASELPSEYWQDEMTDVKRHVDNHFEKRAHCHIIEGCGTAETAAQEIRRAAKEMGVRLVAVDYAQLLKSKGRSPQEEVSNTSKILRQVTNETGIVLLMLCQMNRDIESRKSFLPLMRDLRETGQLEQDADVILFLCWPHVLDNKEDPYKYVVFVSKNRNREITQRCIKCYFNPSRQMVVAERPILFTDGDTSFSIQPHSEFDAFA